MIIFWIVFSLVFISIGVQSLLVGVYCRALKRAASLPAESNWQPPATVVVCLRGADPSLAECLAALKTQRYADYRVLCLLDNADDPAVRVLGDLEIDSDDRFQIVVAENPSGQCSLKCHSLLVALKHVDPGREVVALVDSDCVVDADWLSDLVAPLQQPGVAIATGNRWFTPVESGLGTLIRYLWHVAASVQMYVYRIPWGGSVAFRREFVEQAGLPETWSRSLFEDTLLGPLAKKLGHSVFVNPRILVPTRESIDSRGAFVWIRRQLLNMRLYHPAFWLAVVHCLGTAAILMAAILSVVICWQLQLWALAGVMATALAAYLAFYLIVLGWLENVAGDVLRQRHARLPRLLPVSPAMLVAIAMTQVVYPIATLGALLMRRVRWRGIDYEIQGPFQIRMEEYQPMSGQSDGQSSIEH